MSASSFRHVLAILDSNPDAMWDVLDRAVELAEAEHARLTLAKTSDPGRVVSCLCPLGGVVVCAVPVTESQLKNTAGDRLAQAAEFVPATIPLTTVVLGTDTAGSLRKLVEGGCHDLIVARQLLLTHNRKLRRTIRKLGISTLAVPPDPEAAPRARLLSRNAIPARPATQA